VGDHIRLWGRMQSRIYQKKLDDVTILEKTAYEVSVSKVETVSADKPEETEPTDTTESTYNTSDE
jgi:hypothetical protein